MRPRGDIGLVNVSNAEHIQTRVALAADPYRVVTCHIRG